MSYSVLFAESVMMIYEQSRDTGVLCVIVSLKHLISCLVVFIYLYEALKKMLQHHQHIQLAMTCFFEDCRLEEK